MPGVSTARVSAASRSRAVRQRQPWRAQHTGAWAGRDACAAGQIPVQSLVASQAYGMAMAASFANRHAAWAGRQRVFRALRAPACCQPCARTLTAAFRPRRPRCGPGLRARPAAAAGGFRRPRFQVHALAEPGRVLHAALERGAVRDQARGGHRVAPAGAREPHVCGLCFRGLGVLVAQGRVGRGAARVLVVANGQVERGRGPARCQDGGELEETRHLEAGPRRPPATRARRRWFGEYRVCRTRTRSNMVRAPKCSAPYGIGGAHAVAHLVGQSSAREWRECGARDSSNHAHFFLRRERGRPAWQGLACRPTRRHNAALRTHACFKCGTGRARGAPGAARLPCHGLLYSRACRPAARGPSLNKCSLPVCRDRRARSPRDPRGCILCVAVCVCVCHAQSDCHGGACASV